MLNSNSSNHLEAKLLVLGGIEVALRSSRQTEQWEMVKFLEGYKKEKLRELKKVVYGERQNT